MVRPEFVRSGSRLFVYTYDPVGNLLTSDDTLAGLGTTVQEFDKLDRLTKKVTVAGAIYYEFDRSGMKRSFKDADLKENYYVFDAAGRLEREVLDAGRTAYFFYDDAGLVTTRLAPVIGSNSLMTYMSYDDAGRLKQQEGYARLGGVTDLITYFSYQRNPNGQPTWIRNEGDENTYYEYDALDRLTLEERKSSSSTLYGFRYAFDEVSNRTRKVTIHESDARTYFTYDARNLLDREWVDGGEAAYYTHDAAQRMKRREVTGTGQSAYFTHDQRQQVTRIDFAKVSSADSPATFAYSGTGEAVIAGDNGETTYWQHDGRRLALERLDSTKSAVRRYRNNGPLVEYEEGGGPFQLAFDGEGAVRKGVSPLEGYVPGNFLTSKFGVPLIQTDTLRDGRVKWGGSGVLKLNALNETIYLLGAGGCFLPGPGRITTPSLGGAPGRGFGWHNQVSMVDRGDGLWTGVMAQDRGERVTPLPDGFPQVPGSSGDDPRDEGLPVVTGEEIPDECGAGVDALVREPAVVAGAALTRARQLQRVVEFRAEFRSEQLPPQFTWVQYVKGFGHVWKTDNDNNVIAGRSLRIPQSGDSPWTLDGNDPNSPSMSEVDAAGTFLTMIDRAGLRKGPSGNTHYQHFFRFASYVTCPTRGENQLAFGACFWQVELHANDSQAPGTFWMSSPRPACRKIWPPIQIRRVSEFQNARRTKLDYFRELIQKIKDPDKVW